MKRADKPLYVQVHEALGHKVRLHEYEHPLHDILFTHCCDGNEPAIFPTVQRAYTHRHWEVWFPDDDDGSEEEGWLPCARFDTEWGSGGPLIEQRKIRIQPGDGWLGGSPEGWVAFDDERAAGNVGATPLVAVCNLIVYKGEKQP